MIYVDNAGIPAKVWNKHTKRYVESCWYHLISDEIWPDEIHKFAARLGLRRTYFQEGRGLHNERNPGHDHYDVTVGKRKQAIALGAKSIGIHELAIITMAKTEVYRNNLPFLRLVGMDDI